jgi:hypothetical protein
MDNKTSKLELIWNQRPGGGGATARRYLDFIVDNHSLFEMISDDLIGRLGWGANEIERDAIDILLLKKQPDLPDGRCLLYVCPECGDIGCGALTVKIEKTSGHFVWKEFGYENNYDGRMPLLEEYKHIGPFFFDQHQYFQVLNNYLTSLRA